MAVTAAWIVIIWIVIKLKSSEKILPFVCLGFLFLRARFIFARIGTARFGVLIAGILATMLLVVPLKSFESWIDDNQSVTGLTTPPTETTSKKDARALSFHWKNDLQRTFFVTGGDFPFNTLVRDKTPLSCTENLGFFLAWPFWIGLMSTPFLLTRQRQNESYAHFFWLITTWFAVIIAGFSSSADIFDPRFLNFAYPPGVLLLYLMIHVAESSF